MPCAVEMVLDNGINFCLNYMFKRRKQASFELVEANTMNPGNQACTNRDVESIEKANGEINDTSLVGFDMVKFVFYDLLKRHPQGRFMERHEQLPPSNFRKLQHAMRTVKSFQRPK